jgi:hypothetical protein
MRPRHFIFALDQLQPIGALLDYVIGVGQEEGVVLPKASQIRSHIVAEEKFRLGLSVGEEPERLQFYLPGAENHTGRPRQLVVRPKASVEEIEHHLLIGSPPLQVLHAGNHNGNADRRDRYDQGDIDHFGLLTIGDS